MFLPSLPYPWPFTKNVRAGSPFLHTSTISRGGVLIGGQDKQKTVAPTSRPKNTNCALSFHTRPHTYKSDTSSKIHALVWTSAHKKALQTQRFGTQNSKTLKGERGKHNPANKIHITPNNAHMSKLPSLPPTHRHLMHKTHPSPSLTPCVQTTSTLPPQQARPTRTKKQGVELFWGAKPDKF